MTRVALTSTALGLIAVSAALLIATGCRTPPDPVPLSQLNAHQARGRSIFLARCSLCHYDRRYGDLHGPSLASVFKKPALPSGAAATDERVSATILHGRNNMPAQRDMDEDQLNDLLAYLHTL